MTERLLSVALSLAYGPFIIMACLYLAALILRLLGRPDLLRTLVARTTVPSPIARTDVDREP